MSYYFATNPPGWMSWQSTSANPAPLQVTITDTSAPRFLYVPTVTKEV